MFRFIDSNDRELAAGDHVFFQAPFSGKKPNDYHLFECEILEVFKPPVEFLEKKTFTKIFPAQAEKVYTEYGTRYVRKVCRFSASGRPPGIKLGGKIRIPRNDLKVYTGEDFDGYNCQKIQLTASFLKKIYKEEAINIFHPDHMIRGNFHEIRRIDGNLEARTTEDSHLGCEICRRANPLVRITRIPIRHVKAVFTDHNHVIWLNPDHFKLPPNSMKWGPLSTGSRLLSLKYPVDEEEKNWKHALL